MGLTSNFDEFMNEWKQTVKEINERKIMYVANVVMDSLKFIIVGSAVDTGTYRASNDMTIGGPSSLKLIRPKEAEAGQRQQEANERLVTSEGRLNAFTAEMFEQNGGAEVWITNNLDYAQYLEDGDSTRPGRGLYQAASLRAEANWNKLVQRGLI